MNDPELARLLPRLRAQRGGPLGYVGAAALVLLAVVLNALLWEMIRPQAGPLLLLAVLTSSFYGGLGPGIFAAVLATLGRAVFYQEPLLEPLIEPQDLLMTPIFLLNALLVSWLTAARMRRDELPRDWPRPREPDDGGQSAEKLAAHVAPTRIFQRNHAASARRSVAVFMRTLGGNRAAAWTFVPPLALLALAVVLRLTVGVPIGALTRDRAHFIPGPFYAGVYSTLGLLLWGATAFVCFFAAARMPRALPVERRGIAMFRSAGVLSLMLLADDMLMLHEKVFPDYLGVPENVVLGTLVAAGLWLTIHFRREILLRLPALFLITVICFAASIVSDAMPVTWGQYLIEDGFKLLGIVGWLSFWAQRAAVEPRGSAGAGRAVP